MRFAQEISIFNPYAIELAVTSLGTQITQTAQEIRLEAQQTLANYSTTVQMNAAISVMANQITSEVSQTYATQSGVNDQIGTLSSRITQNSNSISAEVTARQNADSALSTRITQTASSITSEVTARQNADSALSTRITQNANEIDLRVEKDGVISSINASSETITINASKVNLSGYVTVSGLSGGTTTINGSCIKTGTISAERIAANSIAVSKLTGNITNGNWKIDLDNGTFTIGNISANNITTGTLAGVTFKAIGGQYGDITIGNSIVQVPWIDFVTYGVQYAGIAIDADTSYNNSGYHRLITGHGIHIGKESTCTSWFENYVRFDAGYYPASDERMKEEIEPLNEERARALILGLKPSTFRYKAMPEIHHHGFIAQEVRKLVAPDELVIGDEQTEMLGLFYEDLIADLVAVVQQQERRIAALERRS